MRRLLLTLESPADNLALDEALLNWAEEPGPDAEYLRLWESPRPVVVLGRSSRVDQEVNTEFCASQGIPILRRSSGGAAIVAGPGCLMYAVVLSFKRRPQLRGIPEMHRYVLGQIVSVLQPLVPAVRQAGTSDLAFESNAPIIESVLRSASEQIPPLNQEAASIRKFSGNSLRVKQSHCLYHGTLLYDFDLSLINACLGMPVRQPAYRFARGHADFVANLPISKNCLREAMLAAWPTSAEVDDWPRNRVDQLVAEKYSRDDWNLEYGRGEATET